MNKLYKQIAKDIQTEDYKLLSNRKFAKKYAAMFGCSPNHYRNYLMKYKNNYLNNDVNKSIKDDSINIKGIKAHTNTDFNEILNLMISVGERAKQKKIEEQNQEVKINTGKAFGIAFLGDIHAGGKADYKKIKNDVESISAHNDLHAVLMGDLTDNFIIGKLINVQKHQPLPQQFEFRFLEWLIDTLDKSLLAVVAGNHDNWTYKTANIDHLFNLLKGVNCLYGRHEIIFNLISKYHNYTFKLRHKWRNSSVFNMTHGIEVGWDRSQNFDIGIGAHTHTASVCRPFVRHGIKRYAALVGTYKIKDEYAKENGFADSHDSGIGIFVFPNYSAEPVWVTDVKTAINLINTFNNNKHDNKTA